MNEEQEDIVCGSCGIIKRGNLFYNSMGKVILAKDMVEICKLSVELNKCINKLEVIGFNNKIIDGFNRPTNTQIQDMVEDVLEQLKLKGINTSFEDRFVTLTWVDGARFKEVDIKYSYAANTYIEGVDSLLSISINFIDSLEEGYLTFLKPELVKEIKLSGIKFNVLEGNKVVATGVFK